MDFAKLTFEEWETSLRPKSVAEIHRLVNVYGAKVDPSILDREKLLRAAFKAVCGKDAPVQVETKPAPLPEPAGPGSKSERSEPAQDSGAVPGASASTSAPVDASPGTGRRFR